MILGLGMDLAEISRIEKAIQKEHFLERIYSETEREWIKKQGAQTAAGFFAAKEAVAKALGTGFSGFGPWDIEVDKDAFGAPQVRLHGKALERCKAMGGRRMLLTITHESGFAAATVILTDEGEECV